MSRPLAALVALVPAVASADPVPMPRDQVTHYYGYTLTADAISLGTLIAGGFAEGENGRDTELSDTLFTAGILGMSFASPLIHAARGHWRRAGASFLLRGGLAGAGMMVAVTMRSGCDGFLCGLDYIGYGMIGGFALASVIDAASMTEERRPSGTTWAPVVAASRDGAHVGVTATF